MLFTGETERSIDEKSRISIPAEMRTAFSSGIVYASPGGNDSIWLSPEGTFEQKASLLGQSLYPDEDMMDFEQIYFSQSRRLEIDKQGRIRLPETLLEKAEIHGQAYVIGVGDHLEILNHSAWEKKREANLSKLREIMKRLRSKDSGSPNS
jgi:MraZ protein